MIKTVLEKEYREPERPYSQNELQYLRNRLYRWLHLGSTIVHHPDCQHFYIAKANGRKEREYNESNHTVTGSCSVCWKLRRTPFEYRSMAENLVNMYMQEFHSLPSNFNYELYDLESDFYTWLYTEFNPPRRES